MDIVYVYRHSCHADEELKFSLRSVEKHCDWIRKVWIFGDRPGWLTEDTSRVEHIPHDDLAWLGGYQVPIVNNLAMMHVLALHPEISAEFLWFCDDYVLLQPLTQAVAMRQRYYQDLAQVRQRGTGLFKQALWRTFDELKKRNLPGYNFEVHIPVHFTKRRILRAVRELRFLITEARCAGGLAKTAVLNHALHVEKFPISRLAEEGIYAGFHWKPCPASKIRQRCQGKTFLNFDDYAYDQAMSDFLHELFPAPSIYELTERPVPRTAPPTDKTFLRAAPGRVSFGKSV